MPVFDRRLSRRLPIAACRSNTRGRSLARTAYSSPAIRPDQRPRREPASSVTVMPVFALPQARATVEVLGHDLADLAISTQVRDEQGGVRRVVAHVDGLLPLASWCRT